MDDLKVELKKSEPVNEIRQNLHEEKQQENLQQQKDNANLQAGQHAVPVEKQSVPAAELEEIRQSVQKNMPARLGDEIEVAREEGQAEPAPLPEYHIRVAGADALVAAGEQQGYHNCYACSGSLAFNRFLENSGELTDETRTSQNQIRGFVPQYLSFEEVKEDLAGAFNLDLNMPQNAREPRRVYDDYRRNIQKFCGRDKKDLGNVFEVADFFMQRSRDIAVHKMSFNVPGKDIKRYDKDAQGKPVPVRYTAEEKEEADKVYRRQQEKMLTQIKEILEGGNVVSFLGQHHYRTIIGIDGDKLIYTDSLEAKVEKTAGLSTFLSRKGGGEAVEMTWFSKVGDVQRLKADYPNLEYDEANGFTATERPMTDILLVGQRNGVTVSRNIDGGYITEAVYLPSKKNAAAPGMDFEILEPEEDEIVTSSQPVQKESQKTEQAKLRESAAREAESQQPVQKESKKPRQVKQREGAAGEPEKIELPEDGQEAVRAAVAKMNRRGQRLQEIWAARYEKVLSRKLTMPEAVDNKKKKSAGTGYDAFAAEADRIEVEDIMTAIEKGYLVVENKEMSLAQLSAIHGRMLSKKLLFGEGDGSKEMEAVKGAVERLETVLLRESKAQLAEKDIDYIMGLYGDAMNQCQKYLDTKNPWTDEGKARKAMVKDVLRRLSREAESVELGRIAMQGDEAATELKRGVELLSYAAVYEYTGRLRHTGELRKALTEKEELERQITLLQPGVSEAEEAYESYNAAKQEELGFLWYGLRLMDRKLSELSGDLEEKKAAVASLRKRAAEAEERRGQLLEQYAASRKAKKEAADENKKTLLESTEAKIAELPEELRQIANVLNEGGSFAETIRNPRKLSDGEKKTIAGAKKLRRLLGSFEAGKAHAKTIRLHGHFVRFVQDAFGMLVMQTEKGSVPLSFRGDQLSDVIARDIIQNRTLYGDEAARDVIADQKTELGDMTRGELLRSREYSARILHEVTGVPMNQMNNIPNTALRRYADRALDPFIMKDRLTERMKKLVRDVNEAHKNRDINTVLNQELQDVGKTYAQGIVLETEGYEEESGWNEEERKLRDFVADLMFSRDTWVTDGLKKAPGERVRHVLMEHHEAVALLISDQYRDKNAKPQGVVEEMLDKLPVFVLADGEAEELKTKVREALEQLREHIDSVMASRMEGMDGLAQFFAKGVAMGTLRDQKKVDDMLLELLKEPDEEQMKKLAEADAKIDEGVKAAMEGIQQTFDKCVDDLFGHAENEEETKEKKQAPKAQAPQSKNEIKAARKASEAQARRERMAAIRQRMANREKEKKDLEDALAGTKTEIDSKYDLIVQKRHEESDLERACAARGAEIAAEHRGEEEDAVASALKEDERRNQMIQQLMALRNEIKDLENEKKNLEKTREETKKKIKKFPDKTARELEDVLEETARGNKGQGLFMKNVFKTYFKSMPTMDQRSMLAGAIRGSKPAPKMTQQEREVLSKEEGINLISGMMGGMFKGAGPLFQKMLQGMPMGEDIPIGLRKAVADTMDSLAHIPDEVVTAHMDSIIGRSNGKIERIEVKQSLGAASVGQAFLCRIYGPKMKEGKNVVIKLLRPDARNRMMREKKVMLDAARMTDRADKLPFEIEEMEQKNQIGGMEATYLGNLQRIEEELDLTKEAENCVKGAVYDKELIDEDTKLKKPNMANAMKLSGLADPTSDTCVMEIAGTMTLKRYMSGVKDRLTELLEPFCVKIREKDSEGNETGKEVLQKNEDGTFVLRTDLTVPEKMDLLSARDELVKLQRDLDQRQKAMAQLVEKWVSEGVFEAGYYHGDLHAGNIMINDKGVTAIDFGNATELNEVQQEHITRMMIAAVFGNAIDFRHSFHQLLENTPEEVYQEKREELTLAFEEVMSMGDESSAGLRIAVALVRAQEIGLELPPVIANFSSCQMRLQAALNDVNSTLTKLGSNIAKISQGTRGDSRLFEVDVVAKVQNRMLSCTRDEEARNCCTGQLSTMEVRTKEELEEGLRGDVTAFKRSFGIRDESEVLAQIRRMEELVTGAVPTDEEIDLARSSEMDGYTQFLPHFYTYAWGPDEESYRDFLHALVPAIGERVKNCKKTTEKKAGWEEPQPKAYASLEEFAHELGANAGKSELYKNYKVLDGIPEEVQLAFEVRRELEQKPAAGSPEEKAGKERVAALTDRLYALYEEKQKEVVQHTFNMADGNFYDLFPHMIMEDDLENQREKYLNNFKIVDQIFASVSGDPTYAAKLAEAKEKLFELSRKVLDGGEAFKVNKGKLTDELIETVGTLRKAQIATLREMEKNAKGHEAENEDIDPKSFLHIMSDVISRYRVRVARRIGFSRALKLANASEEDNE